MSLFEKDFQFSRKVRINCVIDRSKLLQFLTYNQSLIQTASKYWFSWFSWLFGSGTYASSNCFIRYLSNTFYNTILSDTVHALITDGFWGTHYHGLLNTHTIFVNSKSRVVKIVTKMGISFVKSHTVPRLSKIQSSSDTTKIRWRQRCYSIRFMDHRRKKQQ